MACRAKPKLYRVAEAIATMMPRESSST